MRDELAPPIGDAFGLEPVPPVLAPIQRLPHVDGLEAERIAILIYLSGTARGDTGFYRQRATGFETGHALHCAAIPPGTPLPADPAQGRLSISSFAFAAPQPGT